MEEKEEIATVPVPLSGDYVVVDKVDVVPKHGILFVEARIRDDVITDPQLQVVVSKLQDDLEKQLSSPNNIFELLEDVLVDQRTAELRLGPFYEDSKAALQSLKVVEYLGPKTLEDCYNSNNVRIKVQVYALYHTPRPLEEQKDFPEANITQMPHVMFEGKWDERYKGRSYMDDDEYTGGEINPLILLYGPPGTGKTSLCQGLAQKISIRLKSTYKETQLIQIKTAALMSKYYSESAKQVDKIFMKISRMCQEGPEKFICVLIDEVESIAGSRQAVMQRSESQDSLRATNALLTGLDRTRGYPNVVFLCTSNMLESLDTAFVDRCGLKRSIDPPSLAFQYEILRNSTQKLIARWVIQSLQTLPSYEDAYIEAGLSAEHAGSKLLALVHLIRSGNAHAQCGTEISARSLTQLPEQAILRYLREEVCDLNLALNFFERFVLSEQGQGKNGGDKDADLQDDTDEKFEGIELRGRKRNLKIILEEDSTIAELEELLAELRRKRQRESEV